MEREYISLSRAAAIREYKSILKLVGPAVDGQSVINLLDYASKIKDYFNL